MSDRILYPTSTNLLWQVRHVYMSQGAARLAGGWELQLGGQLDQLGHRADLTR